MELHSVMPKNIEKPPLISPTDGQKRIENVINRTKLCTRMLDEI